MTPFYTQAEHQAFVIGNGQLGAALLIHGFMGTPAEMRPIGEALANGGWKAHGILLPGFGAEINQLRNTSRNDWQRATEAAWDALGHDCKIIIGHSMGAALAILLAAQSKPHCLILTAPFWHLRGWQTKLIPLAKYVIKDFHPFKDADLTHPAIREQFAQIAPDLDLDDADTQKRIREEMVIPMSALHELMRIGNAAHQQAQKITCPILVLQGLQDETVHPDDTQTLVHRIAAPVDYMKFPALGHALVESDEVVQQIFQKLMALSESGG